MVASRMHNEWRDTTTEPRKMTPLIVVDDKGEESNGMYYGYGVFSHAAYGIDDVVTIEKWRYR